MTIKSPGGGERPVGWDSLNLGDSRGGPGAEQGEVWPGQEPEPQERFHDHSLESRQEAERFVEDGGSHQHQYHDPDDEHEQHVTTDAYGAPRQVHEEYDGYGHHGQDDDDHSGRRPTPLIAKLIFCVLALVVVGLVGLSALSTKSPRRDDSNVDAARPTVEPILPPRKIGSDPMTDLARPIAPQVGADDDMRRPQPMPAIQSGLPDNTVRGGDIPDQKRVRTDVGEALTADIRALREALAATNTGLSERATALEDKVAVLMYRNAVLETDVQALKTLMEEKKAAAGKGGGQANAKVVVPNVTSRKAAAQKGASTQRAEAVIADGKGRCALNGATDGVFESDKKPRAWITGETGQMEARAVGDTAPCIGLIRSIRAEDDNWIVVGDKGTLRLRTSGEGR